jgi:hypothetical protein
MRARELVGVGVLLCVAPAGAGIVDLTAGRAVPDIVLPSLDDGRPLSLTDYRGKKVVLHVFASW